MAKEKFIIGKKDAAHHDGRAAEIRRTQQADYELAVGIEEILEQNSGVIFVNGTGKKRGSMLHQRWSGKTQSS